METKRVYIPAYVRGTEFDKDQKEFEFVITTEKRDSYGTIFLADGWNFQRYANNPVVFYQHRSAGDDPDNLIGTTVKGPYPITLEDGTRGHAAIVRLEDEDVNPKAEKIRKKIIAGTLRMASIGADVHEYRFGNKEQKENPDDIYFLRQDLLEWSVVTIGSNPAAVAKRGDVLTEIRSALSETNPGTEEETENTNNELSAERARLEFYKYKNEVK